MEILRPREELGLLRAGAPQPVLLPLPISNHEDCPAAGESDEGIAGGRQASRCGGFKHEVRVGEDTFEMYLRYRYRYTRGCIFRIF